MTHLTPEISTSYPSGLITKGSNGTVLYLQATLSRCVWVRATGGGRRCEASDQRPELHPLQDLRHQVPLTEHQLGGSWGRGRSGVRWHVGPFASHTRNFCGGGDRALVCVHVSADWFCVPHFQCDIRHTLNWSQVSNLCTKQVSDHRCEKQKVCVPTEGVYFTWNDCWWTKTTEIPVLSVWSLKDGTVTMMARTITWTTKGNEFYDISGYIQGQSACTVFACYTTERITRGWGKIISAQNSGGIDLTDMDLNI